ncbi:MAG: histidine phosphatase family protein [Desulfobacterales bacterium]|nr:histidine phosphatase family protein [Desulfobacterales bacterium]
MRIFLLRHGEVKGAGEKCFLGRTDLPLSAKGREQAAAWKARFAGRLPGRIGASPLCRALEFARIIDADRQEKVRTYPALSEIDLGDWDGRPMAEIRANDPASWRARGEDFAGFRPPGGESFADLRDRVVPAFVQLAGESDTDLLLVSHAGVNRVILCHLLGMPLANLFRIGQDPGCLNVIDGMVKKWRVAGINIPVSGKTRC